MRGLDAEEFHIHYHDQAKSNYTPQKKTHELGGGKVNQQREQMPLKDTELMRETDHYNLSVLYTFKEL